MASETSFHSRMFFLCPMCKKAPHSLPGHLRKFCMKESTEAEIQAVVIQAKKELSEFSHKGRFWEFQKIRDLLDSTNPLARMIEEMQSRGLVINNLPPYLPPPAQPSTSYGALSAPEVPQEPAEPNSPTSEESSEEYYQSHGGPVWSSSVRVEMVKKGLYKKHSIDHPLLAGFNRYLHSDLGNRNSKQEVEAVSRFMFYMDPAQPNMLFVRQVEKVREYFNVLSDTKLSKQTILNYWKSLKRFMTYITTSTDVRHKDPALYQDCKSFMDPLRGIHSGMAKKVSKEVTQKRFQSYGKEILPADCLAVLEAAFKDFSAVIGKLQGPGAVTGESLSKNERLLVLYYLEANVMVKLLQRPGVITNMTVEEWQSRGRMGQCACIAVKEHKTAASQLAEVPLTAEMELWFELYFSEVRPVMLQENRTGQDAALNSFFVSSTGRPIYNPSNDLKRLQDRYNLPSVTCGDARRSFETAVKNMPEAQRNAVARLLGHTPETAEKHYRMQTPADAMLAVEALEQACGSTQQASSSREARVDEQTAYSSLAKFYPVTLEGPAPKRARRQELCSSEHERHCYDRWRSEQLKLREQHALENFAGRRPAEKKIEAWLGKQGWTSNVPQASVILKQWKPVESVDQALDSSFVQRMVSNQRWKHLAVRPIPDKGHGVFAKRPFQKGEVVCDYHGRHVARKEIKAMSSHPGYQFVYKNSSNIVMCIDAHDDTCNCHPLCLVYGRLIRHSSKRANIRPRLYSLNDRDVILFIATKDILDNEELLYDYGSKWKKYAGKGLKLDWM